jgi:hypothetical protein
MFVAPQVGARLGELLFIMGVFVAPQVGARLSELLFIMGVFVAPQVGARLGELLFIMCVFPRRSASKVEELQNPVPLVPLLECHNSDASQVAKRRVKRRFHKCGLFAADALLFLALRKRRMWLGDSQRGREPVLSVSGWGISLCPGDTDTSNRRSPFHFVQSSFVNACPLYDIRVTLSCHATCSCVAETLVACPHSGPCESSAVRLTACLSRRYPSCGLYALFITLMARPSHLV